MEFESVDYFRTSEHFSGRKMNDLNEQNFEVYWRTGIGDWGLGIGDRGSVEKT